MLADAAHVKKVPGFSGWSHCTIICLHQIWYRTQVYSSPCLVKLTVIALCNAQDSKSFFLMNNIMCCYVLLMSENLEWKIRCAKVKRLQLLFQWVSQYMDFILSSEDSQSDAAAVYYASRHIDLIATFCLNYIVQYFCSDKAVVPDQP